MRFLILLALLSSCTEINQVADTGVLYKRDVRIVHEGSEYLGIAVLPAAAKYKLEMTFPGQVDLFTFRSCHREVTQEEAGAGTIFGKKNKVSFTYDPVPLETGFCPVEIGGYEQGKGRHSWAFIDFETELEKLPAVVLCNGKTRQYNGVSACQAFAGLVQRITLPRKTIVYSSEGCPGTESSNGRVFDIIAGSGRCVYSFRSVEEPKDYHRMTTIGYEEILIRNVN